MYVIRNTGTGQFVRRIELAKGKVIYTEFRSAARDFKTEAQAEGFMQMLETGGDKRYHVVQTFGDLRDDIAVTRVPGSDHEWKVRMCLGEEWGDRVVEDTIDDCDTEEEALDHYAARVERFGVSFDLRDPCPPLDPNDR